VLDEVETILAKPNYQLKGKVVLTGQKVQLIWASGFHYFSVSF
jgi:hypothetical protein